MPEAVTWFEALNAQTEWHTPSDMQRWVAEVLGAKIELNTATAQRFNDTLSRMRIALADLHFGKRHDFEWLNQELPLCKLRLELGGGRTKNRLPALRVEVKPGAAGASSDALENLRLTLIFQFATFISGTISGGVSIERCKGLYKDTVSIPEAAAFPAKIESDWRREIDVLSADAHAAANIQRCEFFFPRTPKARFCSDSCRYSTFQVMKQLEDPNYLAAKQKKYRSKTK